MAFQLIHGFDLGLIQKARNTANELYRDIDSSASEHRFQRTSSSFLLDAVGVHVRDRLLGHVQHLPQLRAILAAHLGDRIVCDLDQSWMRRQHAVSRSPPGHAPHSWHQDGALAFDFAALGEAEPPPNALAEMITCWIPLTTCGRDAPGLELVRSEVTRLYTVSELTDDHLRRTFSSGTFVTPAFNPGDVLVLMPGCLHRTYVVSAMRRNRTSIELRFLCADRIPRRLRGDRLCPLAMPVE